jgi:hypothetical protein
MPRWLNHSVMKQHLKSMEAGPICGIRQSGEPREGADGYVRAALRQPGHVTHDSQDVAHAKRCWPCHRKCLSGMRTREGFENRGDDILTVDRHHSAAAGGPRYPAELGHHQENATDVPVSLRAVNHCGPKDGDVDVGEREQEAFVCKDRLALGVVLRDCRS